MKVLSSIQIQAIAGGTWQDAAMNGMATAAIGASAGIGSIPLAAIYTSGVFIAGGLSLFAAQQASITRRDGRAGAIGGVIGSALTYYFGSAAPAPIPAVSPSDKHPCLTGDCRI